MTVKPCNRAAYRLGQMEFIDIISFFLTCIMLGLLSPDSAKANVG